MACDCVECLEFKGFRLCQHKIEKKVSSFLHFLLAIDAFPCFASHVASNKRHNKMKYCITYHKNGKAVKVKFATIEAASKAAQDIFECLGVIVGIESIA